jgi:hypothetical protein
MCIVPDRHDTIEATASHMLERSPGPVVRYRLLRDVLRRPPDDPELAEARARLDGSRWVQALAAEQWPDGSWGRFHSQDTQRRQRVPTTEAGVERAVSLGLDRSHPILDSATSYIVEVMTGVRPFPDLAERNDRWSTGVRLFLASTLSLIEPDHPLLAQERGLWSEIARRTFQTGAYRQEDEVQAHAVLTGATVRDSYLTLNGRYQLNLLGSQPGTLPEDVERALLRWLWARPRAIGYLNVPLSGPPPAHKAGALDRWFTSQELLARGFPAWVDAARSVVDWLWAQRDEQGMWDLGPRPASSTYLPLSDSWRKRGRRALDWTTRVLVLLRRHCTPSERQ